jgi:hypothetical protein
MPGEPLGRERAASVDDLGDAMGTQGVRGHGLDASSVTPACQQVRHATG